MARTVTKSNKVFKTIIENDYFYIDKTMFIKEWWDSKETVTLITRPRRFGKSLTMNMVERFFSIRYEGNPKPFENLAIGKDPAMMKLQGTVPVIMLTFATVNGDTYERMIHMLSLQVRKVFERFRHDTGLRGIGRENAVFVREILKERYDEKGRILPLAEETILSALPRLSLILKRKYDKEAIIILDEYDTPLQSAYLNGYWRPAAKFFGELSFPVYMSHYMFMPMHQHYVKTYSGNLPDWGNYMVFACEYLVILLIGYGVMRFWASVLRRQDGGCPS